MLTARQERVLLQLLFYLTPVFYEVRSVPERLRWVYTINPMAHMVDAYRAVLIRGEWPNPWSALGLCVLSITLLAAGMAWFRHASHRFADEL